jgi:hypothetical protein
MFIQEYLRLKEPKSANIKIELSMLGRRQHIDQNCQSEASMLG